MAVNSLATLKDAQEITLDRSFYHGQPENLLPFGPFSLCLPLSMNISSDLSNVKIDRIAIT